MEAKNLDNVSRAEKAATLHNAIVQCMRENHMTLENLDEAKEMVETIYRKNAVI